MRPWYHCGSDHDNRGSESNVAGSLMIQVVE
jgi:hypothetical protein